MVQINMEMPKSCELCPIRDEVYHHCPIVPGVPAWQVEIQDRCKTKRSEHCPLKEVQGGSFDGGSCGEKR